MSAPKHTPGPWDAEKATLDTEWNVYAKDQTEYAEPGDQYIVAGGVREADARLIAAAPELLEALKLVHKCYFLHSEYPRVCEAVDAAIAKAEGRAE